MPRILVMADSTCDIPADWVREHDIRLVPTYVHFGQESLADDGVQLTREAFYRRLNARVALPTTAAPPLGQVIEVLARALRPCGAEWHFQYLPAGGGANCPGPCHCDRQPDDDDGPGLASDGSRAYG